MSDDIDLTNDEMNMTGPTAADKLWALSAYVFTPIIPIVILLMEDKKNRPFLRAHNAQALAWGIVNLVGGTILTSVLFFCFGLPSAASHIPAHPHGPRLSIFITPSPFHSPHASERWFV